MSNKTGSEIGDFLFLIGLSLLAGALLAYDQWPVVQQWIEAWQAPQAAPVAAEGVGPGEWILQNWGASLLVVTLAAAAIKKWIGRGNTVSEDGQTIDYSAPGWVDVKVIE